MKQQNKISHLTYALKCAKDLFEKLKRDAALLDQEVTSDRFFNFVITAFHLCDWVKRDRSIKEKGKCPTPENNDYIAICKEIANASKHFGPDERKQKNAVVEQVNSEKGLYGGGRYGKGLYGEGEEDIKITLKGGTVENALDFKNEVVALWTSFFNNYG